MFDIFTNPWLFFWIAALLILQNVMRAFPQPDPQIKDGFGSNSPGYRFVYTLAQGIKGDMAAFGLDPKTLTQGALFRNKVRDAAAPPDEVKKDG